MLEHTRIRGTDIGLEAGVQLPNLGPIQVEGLDISVSDTGAKSGLLQGHANCTHRRLRSETGHACQLPLAQLMRSNRGHTINCNINNICTSHSCGNHRRSRNTSSIVRVDMNRKVRVLVSDRTNKPVFVVFSFR